MSSILSTEPKEMHPYTERFNRLESTEWAADPSWLNQLRRAGIAHFAEKGIPTVRDEEYRFTNLKSLEQQAFDFCCGAVDTDPASSRISQQLFDQLDAYLVVLVNGRYSSELSNLSGLPEGCVVESLNDAILTREEWVQSRLATQVQVDQSALAALNTAFFGDGLFIHVGRNNQLDKPIQILQLTHPGEGNSNPVATHPRMLVVADTGASVSLVERCVGPDGALYWTNAVSEFFVGPNASVEHLKVQEESLQAVHTAAIQAYLEADAKFTSHSIAVGASISRNDIQSALDGKGSEAVLNGLYLGQGQQLVDHHTLMDHRQPNCNSHEYYHGILTDDSRGVFNGKIYVHQIAQKTDAIQNSRNLVLSDRATVNSKPQLEIFADDVRCTHGATIGQLDEDSVFYLRARGINEAKARRMLIHAFASDVVDRIPYQAVKDYLETILADRFDPKD